MRRMLVADGRHLPASIKKGNFALLNLNLIHIMYLKTI